MTPDRSVTEVITTVKTMRTAPTAQPGEVLRDLLDQPGLLDQPAVCDPLSARFARDAGYQAVFLGGFAIGAHLPLSSEVSPDDVAQCARAVIRACGLPLLLDADFGWGSPGNRLPAMVARLEEAGVAALQLAARPVPDRIPVSDDAGRADAHRDLLGRLRTARAARQHLLLTARCTVPAGSYHDAVRRAAELLAAGADALTVRAEPDELRRLPGDLPGARLIYAGAPDQAGPPAELLQEWGYRGLSHQYYRCYCARRQQPAGPVPSRLRRRLRYCDDLERKQ
jgi:methylisocitrate lyase